MSINIYKDGDVNLWSMAFNVWHFTNDMRLYYTSVNVKNSISVIDNQRIEKIKAKENKELNCIVECFSSTKKETYYIFG